MSTSKGTLALQRLEDTRCNGNWDAVPECCRKVLKHAPGRRCLAMAAQIEARIHKLLPPPSPKASPSTIVSYIISLDALQDTLQEELNKTPPAATKLPSPAGGGYSPVTTADDLIDARVTIAWCCMLKGEWDDVLKLLPTEQEVSEEWDNESSGKVKDGYIHIARIKSLVLQGIALSHTNHKDLALPLQLYRTAIRRASSLPAAQRTSPSFMEWTERALSHSALTAYRCWLESNTPNLPPPPATTCLITPRKHEKTKPDWKTDAEQENYAPTPDPVIPEPPYTPDEIQIGTAVSKTVVDEMTVANAFKGFHSFVADLPGQTPPTITAPSRGSYSQKDEERRELYRHYFRFLSVLLLPEHHPDFPSPRNLPPTPPTDNGNNTISVVHSPTTQGFTAKAGTQSQLRAELKLVQATYEAYLIHTLTFPSAADFHRNIGEFVDVAVLNWRTAGALGSDAEGVVDMLYRAATKTFHSPRILRHLFHTLASMGNLVDALLALETYLDLSENAKERIAKGKIEKDFDSDAVVLVTAAEGVRMVCKHLRDGAKGMKIAKRVEKWIDEWGLEDGEASASVYRGIGTANASWARLTVEGENRDGLLKAAETAFAKSLEHARGDVDSWYGLALAQVDLLDVDAAVDSLGKGISALGAPDSSHTDEGYIRRAAPMLHALSLLLSAQEEYEAAIAACTTALTLISSHVDPTTLPIEVKETALQLQMTLLALEEATDGPETAAGMADNLLSLYTRLFPPALRGTEVVELALPPTTVGTLVSRPSTANRISRIFTGKSGRQYEREYSVSAYDLPNNAGVSCLPAVSRPGTAKLVRPGTRSGNEGVTGGEKFTSQTVRVRGKQDYPSLRGAPKIKVSNTDPTVPDLVSPILPVVAPQAKKSRRFSVSGGTIRRTKSIKSTTSSSTAIGEPTPPIPSTPGTSAGPSTRVSFSRERTPVATALNTPGGRDSPGISGDGVMFAVLKRKLDAHQALYQNGSFPALPTIPAESKSPVDSIRKEKMNAVLGDPPRRTDIPNNLPRSQLPYPLAALEEHITDEGVTRTVKRPHLVPEPMIRVEDERKRSVAALRDVWLCVSGLYRRCGWRVDARGALEEAWIVDRGRGIGPGEGVADIYVERGLLVLETGDRRAATELFESALSVDVDHPGAIVALSQILLDIVPPSITSATSPTPPPPQNTTSDRPKSDRPKLPAQLQTKEENGADWMMRRNRALGLLLACTNSPRGWDCGDAWFALAEVLEKQEDVEGAKKALWRVVGLEDARGVRKLGPEVGVRIL